MTVDWYRKLLNRAIQRWEADIERMKRFELTQKQAFIDLWNERIKLARKELAIAGNLPRDEDFDARWTELVRQAALLEPQFEPNPR